MCELSVLLCVYNTAHALSLAVESILRQTHQDFEFVIVDDGSTDGSTEILERYAENDKRIKLIRQENAGLTAALNVGLEAANGCYIARQDADDISLPSRLEKQLAFMKENPDLLLTGTDFEIIDDDGKSVAVIRNSRRSRIESRIVKSNQLVHGALIFKSELNGLPVRYNNFYKKAQDYDLILRMVEQGRIGIVPEVLYKWRFSKYGILATNITVYGDRALENYKRRVRGEEENYALPSENEIKPKPSRWALDYALAERYMSGYKRQEAREYFTKALSDQNIPLNVKSNCKRRRLLTYLPTKIIKLVREL